MNEALRQRAELHLFSFLSRQRRRAHVRHLAGLDPGDPSEDGIEHLRRFKDAIETYHAVGVLSSSEVETWVRRFHSATEDQRDVEKTEPDPEVQDHADKLLGELLAESASRENASERREVVSFKCRVRALEAVGALSSGEALSWLDRLNARLGLSSVKEEEELERQRTCTGLELHRVVEGTTGGDGALRITHVELYADGAMLYWHAAAPDERPEDRPPTLEPPLAGERRRGAWQQEQSRLTVHDDLGTVYECRQGRHAHATALMPSIPASASRLKVSYGDRRLEIPLD